MEYSLGLDSCKVVLWGEGLSGIKTVREREQMEARAPSQGPLSQRMRGNGGQQCVDRGSSWWKSKWTQEGEKSQKPTAETRTKTKQGGATSTARGRSRTLKSMYRTDLIGRRDEE